MKPVLFYSPYVPPVWITAHGCDPVRLRPRGDRLHASVARVEGLCPYTQAWVSDILLNEGASAIVMTTCCDQMRRAFEVVTKETDLPCFLLNLPHVWRTDSAFQLYQDELRRLGHFLETLGGSRFSEARLKQLLFQSQEQEAVGLPPHNETNGIPLALLGSHGMAQDEELKGLIEQMGGTVVSDGTEPLMPEFCNQNENAFDAMSRAYWGMMEDVFQRPNTRLYERMARCLAKTPVKGVILRRYLWCDLWHAEV
ncbi:MAG: 2-hydroxyacyl-CoA dehydratase, partial [Phycisphaeraceae bacterium]|nr:2-hydroxyacyl-CoA dehydratase [Phycisphaeraceae bacterium]